MESSAMDTAGPSAADSQIPLHQKVGFDCESGELPVRQLMGPSQSSRCHTSALRFSILFSFVAAVSLGFFVLGPLVQHAIIASDSVNYNHGQSLGKAAFQTLSASSFRPSQGLIPAASGFSSATHPAPAPTARHAALLMKGGRKGKARYADDGTRMDGVDTIGAVDRFLDPENGFFSNMWGGPPKQSPEVKKVPKKKASKPRKFDPLGGLAYRDTESARLRGSSYEGQRIRAAKIQEYIYSDAEPADPFIVKLLFGTLILTLIVLLIAVVGYYGIDGLNAAPRRM